MFYLLDEFLAYLQHKGKFELAIKIGEFFSHFAIFENSRLLIQSRVAFLYNYKDKEIAFNKIKELASKFGYDEKTEVRLGAVVYYTKGPMLNYDSYSHKKLALIAKIFDMYAISLQIYKKNYEESLNVDLEAAAICHHINDSDRLCHIYIHIISASGELKHQTDVEEMLKYILSNSKQDRVKFCAYIETIRYYNKIGMTYTAQHFKNLTEDFIEKNKIRGKYPNEEKEYNKL